MRKLLIAIALACIPAVAQVNLRAVYLDASQVLTNGCQPQYNTSTQRFTCATSSSVSWGNIVGTVSAQSDLQNALNLKANLASPTFTGSVNIPTPSTGDNSTLAASTAWVRAQNYLTGNQTITFTGDLSGSGQTSVALTLASTGVAPNSYTCPTITVDSKGRITAAANGVCGGGGGGTPGGTNGQLQINNAGVFGGVTAVPAANFPALTGDVTTSAGSLATTIQPGVVTLAKLANLAASSIICNTTGGAATPTACTPSQIKTLLSIAIGDVSSLQTSLDNKIDDTEVSTTPGANQIPRADGSGNFTLGSGASRVTLTEGTAPSSPASTQHVLYVDSADGHVKRKDSAGTVVDLESGGSGLTDPGGNGLVKRTALNTTEPANPGTDYYAPGFAIDPNDIPKVGTNSSFVTGTVKGTTGNCMQWTSTGAGDSGAPCGTGSGGSSGGGGGYSQSFTSQTSVSLTHNLGTKNLTLQCFDGSDNAIQPNAWSIGGSAPYDVAVSFTTAQTGRCVVNGMGRYATSFTSSTSVSITAANHGFGTCDLNIRLWDASTNPKVIEADSIECNATTKDITIAFATSQSGRVLIQ